jgi:tetratricopeptide (TPR) repeat protein
VWSQTSTKGAAACGDAEKAGDFKRTNLVGDCTRAFLEATKDEERADALTNRSMAWLMSKADEDAATDDNVVAAGIFPSADNLSNLGFGYIRAHHSTAAKWVFDKSIALKPSFVNYSGRASARFNVGDIEGAFEDAKKSNDLQPNDVALTVLGDCFHAKYKSFDKAKVFWIAAYHLGDRDDGLIQRLKDAGVPIPPPDDPAPAKSP